MGVGQWSKPLKRQQRTTDYPARVVRALNLFWIFTTLVAIIANYLRLQVQPLEDNNQPHPGIAETVQDTVQAAIPVFRAAYSTANLRRKTP